MTTSNANSIQNASHSHSHARRAGHAARWLAASLLLLVAGLAAPVHAAAAPAAAAAVAPAATTGATATNAAVTTPRVTRTAFDHLTTGFELIGKHRDLPCESCHVNAIFKGTAKDCAACHGVGTQVHAVGKPVNHILASNRCDSCHTPVSFNPAVNFDHAEVRGTCSSCHGPNSQPPAQHQGPGHIPTDLECDACHSTIGWGGAAGASMPLNHIPTSQACGLCHTDATNFAIYTMNHTGITSGCAACHASGLAFANIAPPELVQPPANHIDFGTAACESCHLASSTSTGGFMFTNASGAAPPAMVHTAIAAQANCSSCHDAGKTWAGTPATVTLPIGHVPTAGAQCSSCHAGYTTFKFTNASGAAAPAMVHSAVASIACSSCHEKGVTDIGVPATVVRPLLKASGATHIATGECSTCHFNTTSFKGATDLATNHIPLLAPTTVNCADCHSNANDYSIYTMNHADVTNVCSTCHASGKGFQNMVAPTLKQPPANHVPFGTAECATCHSATTFTSFVMANASGAAPPAMVHAGVPGTACATCHGAGLTWVGVPATITSSATGTASPHVPLPTGVACESCHLASSTATGGFSMSNVSGTAAPAMVHAQVASIACDQCHASGKVFAGAPATKVVPPNHVPFPAGTACTGCHLASSTATGGFVFSNASTTAPAGMVHTLVASIACATCHEKGLSWIGTPATVLRPALKASGAPHTQTGACSDCHLNTVSFKGASDLPGNHIPLLAPTTVNCTDCHSNASDYSIYTMNHADVATTCSTCHATGKSFANMAPPALKVPPTNHVPFGTAECTNCHSASTFTSFTMTNASGTAPPAMVHAVVPGVACATCHATGQSWVGTPTTKAPPANHVPFGTVACESCHTASNVTSFQFTNASTTAAPGMVHTTVTSTACSTCHEKGLSWVGVPATVLRPALKASGAPHTQTSECSTCHFNTVSFKGATDLPTNHLPLLAPTTVNCADCHSNAADYTVYTMNHADVTAVCSTCHAAGKSFANMAPPTLKQPPTNHVPFGTAECALCHSPTNFTTFVFPNASTTAPSGMVHTAVPGVACATCHATGKTWAGTPATKLPPTNHIPFGTAACEACHAPANFTTFVIGNVSGTAPPSMVHSVVSSITCDQCHAAGKTFVGTPVVKVVPTNHVPFGTAACTGCHLASSTATGGFVFTNASTTAPAGMVHSLVTSIVCSACHEAGKTWIGTPATKVRPALKADGTAHVASGECSTCHFNTTSFKGATDLPANHIPLPAADKNNCALCHLTAGNYSIATMNHVNITSNCIQCHGYGLSFANMAPPTLVAPPSGPTGHIPSNKPNGTTDIACEQCHLPTVFTTFSGTIMKHAAVRAMTCMSCHELGMKWKTNTGVRLWVRDGANHHKGQDCGGSGCHSTRDKMGARVGAALTASQKAGGPVGQPSLGAANALGGAVGFSHRRLAGQDCVTCHGPASTMGKPASHMATSNSCDSCHGTGSWSPLLRMDHMQASGTCASCHNGKTAPGKNLGHIASNSTCETCHTTNAWTPARFDHVAVAAGTCRGCHDSVHAQGQPLNHVPTSAQCDTCHGTLAWKPAKLDHTTLAAPCASCHNNSIALGTSSTHMQMQRDCATCHSYPDWTLLHFRHVSASYPGEHRAALTCVNCHTANTDQIPWKSPADAGTCAGCHAASFRPDLHPKVSGGAKYTASELANCAGACHVYSDSTLGTISKSLPGPYHKVTDAAFKH